jgi:hypothetical protein
MTGTSPTERFWTPARKAQVRELWMAGVSSGAIADALGATKAAVRGQANIMKLPHRCPSNAERLSATPLQVTPEQSEAELRRMAEMGWRRTA